MDLGTPARYRQAAPRRPPEGLAARLLAAARRRPWPATDRGDGSDGSGPAGKATAGDGHGGPRLRTTTAVAEVDAFVSIGHQSEGKGIPVPAIYFADTLAGLVFLEDLGGHPSAEHGAA